jgi:O-antigen/teichoic acid export membrane protein
VFVAATRLQSYILMLPATLTTVLLPAFSNLYAQSRSEFLVKFNGVVKLLYWISIPLSLMFSINAGGIVRFVYGSKFLNAAPLLSILALILMSGSSYAFGSTMLIIGKRYLSLALYGITTVFIAAFSLVFIPRWGVEAACWAQFGGAALGIVIYPAYLYRFFSINFPFLYLAKVIGATIAMAVLDRSLLAWNFPFILAGAIAWGGLIAVSYLLGIFKGSEWSVVKHLVDKFYAFIKRPPTLQGI